MVGDLDRLSEEAAEALLEAIKRIAPSATADSANKLAEAYALVEESRPGSLDADEEAAEASSPENRQPNATVSSPARRGRLPRRLDTPLG